MRVISQKELFPKDIERFLKTFRKGVNLNNQERITLDFEIEKKTKSQKLSPIIKVAQPEDAHAFVDISINVYEGTYPFKEMEDEDSVREMILSEDHHLLLFKDNLDNNIGCFKCILDFKKKRGYMGGFMIKKEYQSNVDIVKAIIGSYVWMWSTFKDRIALWYCENRTAHATAQYITSVCGIKTVGFLPNKDIFFKEVESEVFGVIYNKKTLSKLKCKEYPKLIPEINNCFVYANNKYNLGPVEFIIPSFNLNPYKLAYLKKRIIKNIEKDKIGYETITFSFKSSNSYFKFVYTPWLQNFEKTEYKVNDKEELIVFLHDFKKLTNELNIRYVEVLVSSFNPTDQRVFHDAGFIPRGYVPCWNYNKELNCYEDYIVFNKFIGEIKNLILLPEGLELLEILELEIP